MGEKKNKEKGPKSESGQAKPKVGHKGAKEEIMFQNPANPPTNCKKPIKK